jgi:Zn-dependent protease
LTAAFPLSQKRFLNKTIASVVHELMKKRFPWVPVLLAVLAVSYIGYAMIQPSPRKHRATRIQAQNHIAGVSFTLVNSNPATVLPQ